MVPMLKNNTAVILSIICFTFLMNGTAFAVKTKLRIAASDWAPYTSNKLSGGGFLTEICTTALERAGYQCEVDFIPWKRAVKMTKKGKYHCLIGASYTDERTGYFLYTDYFWETSVHFFAKKGHKLKYSAIDDLCFTRLGILRGSFYVDRFKKYKCLTVETVPTVQQNMRKLVAGRLDIIIDTFDSVQFYMANELTDLAGKIEPIFPSIETDKIYLVISKQAVDNQAIQRNFDAGIGQIKYDGTYDEILKKHGKQ